MTSEVPAEVLGRYGRDPLAAIEGPPADTTDDILRHAVLLFGPPDGRERWAYAAQRLAEEPGLAAGSVHLAAAAGDADALRSQVAADPAAAGREGGPFGWPPLLYLTYGRLGLAGVGGDPVGCAEQLLAAGADPDAGYLWQGLPTPFTALTGVFGSATDSQPTHPHADRLARLLLAAGADANDGQALYNRMFVPDDRHLELLFAYGLGQGDGGPWHRRLPELTDAPEQLVSSQLGWAVVHGLLERIRLLAGHGVDLVWRCGRPEVAALLVDLGVPDDVDAESRQVGRLLTGDRTDLAETDVAGVRAAHPALVLRAAVADRPEAVKLLVDNGFDVNALGRQDIVVEQRWETALHHAAGEGKVELAALLLSLGADPSVRDARFGATPLGWAREFEQAAVVELLEPASPPG